MYNQQFWQTYINKNSDVIDRLIDKNYKKFCRIYKKSIHTSSLKISAIDANHFVHDRLMKRLIDADTLYKNTDEKDVPLDDKSYFIRQISIIVHSYFWSSMVSHNYNRIESIIRWKCFPDEQDDVHSYIHGQLVNNDFRILRRFNQKKKQKNEKKKKITPEKYLENMVQLRINAFFDNGCNIPTWISRLKDNLLQKIYQYLCCRKKNEEDFIPKLKGHKFFTIEKNIDLIQKSHPNCGYQNTEVSIDQYMPGYKPNEMDIESITLMRLLNITIFETYEVHPADTLIIKSLKKDLNRANIRPSHRMMLRLYFFEGYTYKEIGEKMGMRTDQVSGQIRPVRETIKSILSKYL